MDFSSSLRPAPGRFERVLSRVVGSALLVLWWLLPLVAASPWPHEGSDLSPDPAVTWGRLDNGLRYAIRANPEPAQRVSLRLLVLAGSLQEADDERGFAHFVEHMAFNGTRLYPKESIVGVLQRFGMAHGPDLNAHTLLDHTIYKLEMPTSQAGRLEEGLLVLREFADGVTFDADEVEREKAVIESERTARNTPGYRSLEALRNFSYPRTPFSERLPIGRPESVRDATPARLRAFYEKWYRADNFVVLLVGDFDVAEAERQVRAAFGSLPAPAGERPDVAAAVRIPANPATFTAAHHSDGIERGAVGVQLIAVTPYPAIDRRADRERTILRNVAFNALTSRLSSMRLREGKKFGAMSVSFANINALANEASLRVDANGRHWRDAVFRAEQEWRRALTHGFTANEIKEITAVGLSTFEHAARTAPTRTSTALADRLANSLVNRRVFTTPETDLEIMRAGLAAATADAVLAEFRRAWGEGKPRLFANGTLPAGIGPAQLVKALEDSARKRVAAPKNADAGEFAYTDFGPPGAVAKRTHHAATDIHCVEFANGVKVNLKVTDFTADAVTFRARFGTGQAGEPSAQPGLRMVMGHGFLSLGLGRHSQDQLAHLSAGVVASITLGVSEDAFTATGSSDGEGAERWLQLLTASLSDPGWRKEQLPEIRQRILYTLQQSARDTGPALNAQRSALLANRDSRYTSPTFDKIKGYSVADLRAWVEPQLKSGSLEIGIVGDFELEAMIELAARTVGCLPPRGAATPVRPVKFVDVVDAKPITVLPVARNGEVSLAWALPPERDHASVRKISVLAAVLANRLKARIREEMGATYSPACGTWRSEVQPERAYLLAGMTCGPGETKRVADAVRAVADELARGAVTEEEFERARQPMIQSTPAQLRTNAYWLGAIVAQAQSRPEDLELVGTRVSDLEALTPADITALAAQTLLSARASVFTAQPAAVTTKKP